MPVIDSHCHAWNSWRLNPTSGWENNGGAEQLIAEMDANAIDQAIVVSARTDPSQDNNDYVAQAAAKCPLRLHQFADVDSVWTDTYHVPRAAARLDEVAERWPVKGVTHYLADSDDGWLTSKEGLAFFRVAAERSLIVSLSAPPCWQSAIREVARAYPTVPIICHHLGFVLANEEPPFPKLSAVLASANVPNILFKISGYNYVSHTVWDFPYSDSLRTVRLFFEHFGPYRLCWGSDYPMVLAAMTYRQSVEVLRSYTPFIPDREKSWIFGETMEALLRTGQPIE